MSDLNATHAWFVRRLVNQRYIRSAAVEQAFMKIFREDFLPSSLRAQAYHDAAIAVKWDPQTGSCVSSCSQPSLTAMMLEMLHLHPGLYTLDIGTGTGYTAALLCTILHNDTTVFSMDIDEDLIETARQRLKNYELFPRLFTADALKPWPFENTFDRLLVSAGVPYIPSHWIPHLNSGAQIVLPFCWGGVDYLTHLTFSEPNVLEGNISIFTVFTGLRSADIPKQSLELDLHGTRIDLYDFPESLPKPISLPYTLSRQRLPANMHFHLPGMIEGFHIYTLAAEPFPSGGLRLAHVNNGSAGFYGHVFYAFDPDSGSIVFLPMSGTDYIFWTAGPAESLKDQLIRTLNEWQKIGSPTAAEFVIRFLFQKQNEPSGKTHEWFVQKEKNDLHILLKPNRNEATTWI